MYTVSIDTNDVVHRLIEAIDPDRIILFGSRARGAYAPDSDVDLLIISESAEPRHCRAIRAYRALRGLGIPKDILWYTPTEVAEWQGVPNHVVHHALAEGRVLYEKRR